MIASQKGFAHIIILAVVLLAIVILGYFSITSSNFLKPVRQDDKSADYSGNGGSPKSFGGVSWQFNNETGEWSVAGNTPECEDPFIVQAPVDVKLASGILYPGQLRGGDYKPHGGFRFDNSETNDVELRAAMDGYLLKASKYEAFGEVQILIFYVNDCGIMVMNDHLLTPSPKLKEIIDKIPLGKEGDSRTTNIEPRVYLEKGELLATEVGFRKFSGGSGGKNVFVDFGLYDLRNINDVVYDSAFRAEHSNINEYGTYALCWFDNLMPEDKDVVLSLPAGGNEGKVSDYCN